MKLQTWLYLKNLIFGKNLCICVCWFWIKEWTISFPEWQECGIVSPQMFTHCTDPTKLQWVWTNGDSVYSPDWEPWLVGRDKSYSLLSGPKEAPILQTPKGCPHIQKCVPPGLEEGFWQLDKRQTFLGTCETCYHLLKVIPLTSGRGTSGSPPIDTCGCISKCTLVSRLPQS